MALASVADIKRVMHITGTDQERDAQLAEALEAAESWFAKRAKQNYDQEGTATATFHDVYEDAQIWLPVDDATISEVRVNGLAYSTDQYTFDGQALRLRPYLFTEPFEGAVGRRYLGIYRTVEVDYASASGGVPAAIRDGVARLAGWLWQTGPRQGTVSGSVVGAIKSESLGGYSYTLEAASHVAGGFMAGRSGFEEAVAFLRPFMKRARVSVT